MPQLDNYCTVGKLVSELDARLLTHQIAACRTIFHFRLVYHVLRQRYE